MGMRMADETVNAGGRGSSGPKMTQMTRMARAWVTAAVPPERGGKTTRTRGRWD